MNHRHGERGEGRLGCVLWVLFVGLVAYAGYVIIPVKFAASRFQDFIAEEAAFGSNRGNAQIISEMLGKARELELPVTKEQIEITRTRESITIAAHYVVPVSFFFDQFRYEWRFDPLVERPLSAG